LLLLWLLLLEIEVEIVGARFVLVLLGWLVEVEIEWVFLRGCLLLDWVLGFAWH